MPAFAIWCALLIAGLTPNFGAGRSAGPKTDLPSLPNLSTSLLPLELAEEAVKLEMYERFLAHAVAKFGENSSLADFYRSELKRTQLRAAALRAEVDRANDPKLTQKVERVVAAELERYLRGLSMTPMELADRSKREREEGQRLLAEIQKRRDDAIRIRDAKR